MINYELIDYVRRAREGGHSERAIRSKLHSVGWTEEDADRAFVAVSSEREEKMPAPPSHEDESSASGNTLGKRIAFWDMLQYIMLFVAMWAFVVSFVSVIHGIIDVMVPVWDVARDNLGGLSLRGSQRVFQFWVALLIVSFPLFVFLFLRTVREHIAEPSRRTRLVHRVHVYLTLMIAFFVLFGGSILFLFSLLTGDMTWNDTLKMLVMFVAYGLLFGYYLLEIKPDWGR